MYDNHYDDFTRDDAEHVIDRGTVCDSCVHPNSCREEGACIRHLEIAEREPSREQGQRL